MTSSLSSNNMERALWWDGDGAGPEVTFRKKICGYMYELKKKRKHIEEDNTEEQD